MYERVQQQHLLVESYTYHIPGTWYSSTVVGIEFIEHKNIVLKPFSMVPWPKKKNLHLNLFFVFCFFLYHQFYFPAQLVRGFTLSDLLDKPWSRVSSLLSSGTCLQFLFERSEFLIATSKKKKMSVCVDVRLILVLVWKTLILVLVCGTYYVPATYVPGTRYQPADHSSCVCSTTSLLLCLLLMLMLLYS